MNLGLQLQNPDNLVAPNWCCCCLTFSFNSPIVETRGADIHDRPILDESLSNFVTTVAFQVPISACNSSISIQYIGQPISSFFPVPIWLPSLMLLPTDALPLPVLEAMPCDFGIVLAFYFLVQFEYILLCIVPDVMRICLVASFSWSSSLVFIVSSQV